MSRSYATILKPGILFLLVFSGVTAVLVAGGWATSVETLALVILGGTLASGSANILNNYIDRDLDGLMARTRWRPLPAGKLRPSNALVLGLALGVASVAVLWVLVNFLAALLALAGILFYVLVYTVWLKPRTPQNIVLGGIAGGFPALVGWAAMTDSLALTAGLIGLLVILWTPPHFWALALVFVEDYRKAGVPMLPVIRGEAETRRQILGYALALLGVSLLAAPLAGLGGAYLVAALALGIPFVLLAFRLLRDGSRRAAGRLFSYSIWYLLLLFAAMIADRLLPLNVL